MQWDFYIEKVSQREGLARSAIQMFLSCPAFTVARSSLIPIYTKNTFEPIEGPLIFLILVGIVIIIIITQRFISVLRYCYRRCGFYVPWMQPTWRSQCRIPDTDVPEGGQGTLSKGEGVSQKNSKRIPIGRLKSQRMHHGFASRPRPRVPFDGVYNSWYAVLLVWSMPHRKWGITWDLGGYRK